jgi:hypothetical protein
LEILQILGNTQLAGSISIGAMMTSGTISIGGTGSQTGTIGIGTGTGAQTLNFGTGGTGSKTINIGTGAIGNVITIGTTTGAASIAQKVGTGDFTLDGVGSSDFTIGASTTTGTIAIGGTAQSGNINLGASSASQTVNIGTGSAAATVNIATGDVAGNINIGDNTSTPSSSVRIGGSTTINGALNFGVDAFSGNDAYAITLSPAPTAYVAGMVVIFKAGDSNAGNCTMDVNGLGVRNILRDQTGGPLQPLADGNIDAGGVYIIVYDGTQFVLIR